MADTIKAPVIGIVPKTAVEKNQPEVAERKVETAAGDNEEYIDHSSVTIALVQNYCLYRKANSKVLPKRVDFVGSSISSSRILASNKREVEKYFPNLVGLSPNNDRFITEVKTWLGNIRVPISELGKKLNTSFRYYKKSDYYKVANKLEYIEAEYNRIDRHNLQALREGLERKITAINELESEKSLYGEPVNVEEYLIYRHCLLYKDIAKDLAFINSDSNIRFYFKDDKKEADKFKKYRDQIVKAKSNYVTALSNTKLFDAIYIQYCRLNNYPIISNLNKDRISREVELDKYSQDEPLKFNKLFENKDIELVAQIELLIARGELVRSEYNQQISTIDGTIIGANMNDAVVWFKNPENISEVNAYKAKLNNM